MLRITAQKSSAQVKTYYERSDYYEDGPNALKGHWFGKGAERLGLDGMVDKAQFERIVENRHPWEDESLTPRTRADRRVGWDFTFSASKSVSILWALTKDNRILDIVRESVNETLAEIEQDVLTRVHVGKTMHTEKTGNIIAATWLHTTSRPVAGIAMPGLHVHAWLANATYFGDRFKAMDISAVKKDGPYYEARFHSRLAQKLKQRFGLSVERQGKKWFEIRGMPREIVERYSERLKQIEQVAREKGIVDAKQKSELGARTREAKTEGVSPESLHKLWRSKLSKDEFAEVASIVKLAAKKQPLQTTSQEAVDFAIEHRFEGQSSVRERQLITDSIWRGIGDNSVQDIDLELSKRELIRDGENESAWVTTPEVLEEERRMLRFARHGRGSSIALAETRMIKRDWLSDEQQSAVRQIWKSRDRVIILSGKAGVGKTKIAEEAVEGIQEHGHRVVMVAPTTKAVDVLNSEGFEANTLAKLLKNKEFQSEAQGQVIWVDEAGLVSTRDMAELFGIANELKARVVLAGDKFQHPPIGRGKPLEQLEQEAGLKPISIQTIRRQEDAGYRRAVEKLSRGDVQGGFAALEKLGMVRELSDEVRDKRIAMSYVNSVESGTSTLVIAPSLAEKQTVTAAIRDELRTRGRLGSEVEITTLKPTTWSQAERQDALLYSPGDVVEFHARGQGGFLPGDRAEVQQVDAKRVMVKRNNNTNVELPLQSSGAFSVFSPAKTSFAAGDTIKITRNRRAKPGQQRLSNGSKHVIKSIDSHGGIVLENGLRIDSNWGHLEHGVVSTSFSSQGDTKDKVIVAQSSRSFAASSPEQIYVSASRGRTRQGLEIYTDDVAGLRRAIGNDRSVMSATELALRAEHRLPHSRIKGQIARIRHFARRATEYLSEHVQRFTQTIPIPPMQEVSASR